MSVSVGEFLYNLAKKAGMNPEDENLKNFLQNGELVKINLPEDIEKGIDNKLISLSDAKNNHPEIKNFYQKQALDGIDKSVDDLLEELQADEETKTLIKAERSTYKRVPLLVNKIKELESKKAGAGKTDKAEIQKEIDGLHAQLRAEKENAQKLKTEYEGKLSDFKREYKLESLLSAYKTIYDDLDPEVKNTTIKTLINKHLQDNKAKLLVDDNGNLILQKEDGTNYYGDNNQQIEPKAFIEQTLSRNKLLKVTDHNPSGQGDTNNGQQQRQPNGGTGGNTANKSLSGLVQNSLKNLENSGQVSVMG